MSRISKIFSLAQVSEETTSSRWILIPKSQVKFGANDLKQIESLVALECKGNGGSTYWRIKARVGSKAYWWTLDYASAERVTHNEAIDPKRVVVYMMSDSEEELDDIVRARILGE